MHYLAQVPPMPPGKDKAEPTMSRDTWVTLSLLGGVVLVIVLFLAFDWFRSRHELRRLELRRRQARDSYQEELRRGEKENSEPPS